MRKVVFIFITLSVLVGSLLCTLQFQITKADTIITIEADGSIDPPTAPISTTDYITYKFTDNIIGQSVVVMRDNIVLDGNSHTLQGSGSGDGIYLYGDFGTKTGRTNVSIENTRIVDFNIGIHLYYSLNCSVSENNVTDSAWCGIWIDYSSNSTVSGNNITNSTTYGIGLYYSSANNTMTGDNITGNGDGIYLEYSSNNTISGENITGNNDYGIELYSSSDNNTVSGNNITNNENNGILMLDHSSGNIVSNNEIANNIDGIVLYSSSNNTITGDNITNDTWGVHLYDSENNSINRNQVTANGACGIALDNSSYNTISGNDIMNNWLGIDLYVSSNETIIGNTIADNDEGIHVAYSSDSKIYHNNLLDNINAGHIDQVYSIGSVNVWDNGYPSGGNRWSDYVGNDWYYGPHQDLLGSDGIGDTPYVIDSSNRDNYPLYSFTPSTEASGYGGVFGVGGQTVPCMD